MNRKIYTSNDESDEKQTHDAVPNSRGHAQSDPDVDWTLFVESMWVVVEMLIITMGLFYMLHKGILVQALITGITITLIMNKIGVDKSG